MLDPFELKRRWFPKGIRRPLSKTRNRILRRTSRRSLARALSRLAIPRDSTVCIHSMLSGLGYLTDGPHGVIGAVQDAVPGCTIMVPTFPVEASTAEYVSRNGVFDPQCSPSTSGLLTEILWRCEGAVRGFHPTHACAALGPKADDLIEGCESSETPFGTGSSYGRFARRDDAVLLLIHTNNTSLVHVFQETAGTPNLFLEGLRSARSLDRQGRERSFEIKVHRPKLPLFVALAGEREDDPEYVWLPDYCLQSPAANAARIFARLRCPRNRDFLRDRQHELVRDGVIRSTFLRDAELISIAVKPYLERICRDLAASYRSLPSAYALETLEAAERAGRLGK